AGTGIPRGRSWSQRLGKGDVVHHTQAEETKWTHHMGRGHFGGHLAFPPGSCPGLSDPGVLTPGRGSFQTLTSSVGLSKSVSLPQAGESHLPTAEEEVKPEMRRVLQATRGRPVSWPDNGELAPVPGGSRELSGQPDQRRRMELPQSPGGL